MAIGPKYTTLDSSLLTNVHACLINDAGELESVLVSFDTGDEAIVWDQRRNMFKYKCFVSNEALLVPQSLLGTDEEVLALMAQVSAARDTGLAPVILAGIPHKPAISQHVPDRSAVDPAGSLHPPAIGSAGAVAAAAATKQSEHTQV